MSSNYGRNGLGLYTNGHFEMGSLYNFTSDRVSLYSGSVSASVSSSANSNGYCMVSKTNQYGYQFNSDEYIEVDGSSSYQFSVMLKTVTPNYLGNPGSGYFGFSVYDKYKSQISPNHLYKQGATTLSRNLNVGDSYIYVTDATGWYQNATFSSVQSRIVLYSSDHPDYSTPYQYSRVLSQSPSVNYDCTNVVWTGTDYQLTIVNTGNTPITLPSNSNITDYDTTAGTPIGNSSAGGGHQYVLGGNIDIPYDDWLLKKSNWITGFGNSDSVVFRWGTKYVRFLALLNYKYRLETSGDSAEFLMDNIMLIKKPFGISKTYPDKLLTQTQT